MILLSVSSLLNPPFYGRRGCPDAIGARTRISSVSGSPVAPVLLVRAQKRAVPPPPVHTFPGADNSSCSFRSGDTCTKLPPNGLRPVSLGLVPQRLPVQKSRLPVPLKRPEVKVKENLPRAFPVLARITSFKDPLPAFSGLARPADPFAPWVAGGIRLILVCFSLPYFCSSLEPV